MAHQTRILGGRTLRFNECVCAPYNADFDGDEMNLHVPQTEEARAEAVTLLAVSSNLITPRNGQPLVTATQDFLTASFLMTQNGVFLSHDEMCRLCFYATGYDDGQHDVDLPNPAIVKPAVLWTGKQVWSVLLCPNRNQNPENVSVTFHCRERNYSGKTHGVMCRREGYIIFRDSELVCGNLGKKALGGSKSGLFFTLIRDHSESLAVHVMNRMTKCVARWLSNYGFTIGIDDVTPSRQLTRLKHKRILEGYQECERNIELFNHGRLNTRPGCNEEESLESEISGTLSNVREVSGRMCMENLPWHNKPRIMATSGSKGSQLNMCQMIACVGQQIVGGHRMPEGFILRTLPHFRQNAKDPAAKGFVRNSFYTGMTAPEFFFHTMGGREGLVDTAVKTAETGYMARRLMKALEDLSIRYDNTVRNSAGGVVQFAYGDDMLNPAFMEGNNKPVEFKRLLQSIKAGNPCPRERAMTPRELRHVAASAASYSTNYFASRSGSNNFFGEVCRFVESLANDVETIEQSCWPKRLGDTACRKANNECGALVIENSCRTTATQIQMLFAHSVRKYHRALTEPGEAVGAVGAQSLGEPGTQMTLKTFHFAGVASMNVTLGVPRIKEIINASKRIETPIITVKLVCDSDERSARIVKGRIERTTLDEIALHIREVYSPTGCFLNVRLDVTAVERLHLDISAATVRRSILLSKLKLNADQVSVVDQKSLRIEPRNDIGCDRIFFAMQDLKQRLRTVIVRGIGTVKRAVVNVEENTCGASNAYHLLVEGHGLLRVLGVPGVEPLNTKTNHITEMECTLGIEAARRLIMDEVKYIFSQYGLEIDQRHLMLLADVMSYRGQVLGITRFGIAKMKESVLMLASFEKTADHLFDAAVHARRDAIDGVSECIIMGTPIPLGTGMFKLRLRTCEEAIGGGARECTAGSGVNGMCH